MKWSSKASLYYHTALHLKPSQIAWRAFRAIRGHHRRVPTFSQFDAIVLSPMAHDIRSALLCRLNRQEASETAKQALRKEFQFLSKVHSFSSSVDWNIADASRLWRFHLNYFDYSVILAVENHWTDDSSYGERAIGLMMEWIRDAEECDDAWHPYPTSLRICNWIFTLTLLGESFSSDEGVVRELLGSLFRQSRYLSKNLELDLRGNHLFENARALYISSIALAGPNGVPWARRARGLLLAQLAEQIRSDGGHFENSPMYHCAVLAGVLDCLLFTPATDREMHERLTNVACAMLGFLNEISYEDGTYPLFNDSATNMTISPSALKQYARAVLGEDLSDDSTSESDRASVNLMTDSGCAILSGHGIRLVADGGELGPDYQPGHGHCDTLSYELHKDGVPVIVDSGVFGYENDEMRHYCRSTEAHNTVRLDGQEQSEIWGAFRVARRAKPSRVNTYSGEGFVAFDGSHDGYARLPARGIHRRRIVLLREYVVVLDELEGHDVASIESYLHLDPRLSVDVLERHALVGGAGCQVAVLPFGTLQLGQLEGWVCREFGKRVRNNVILLKGKSELPVSFGYVLGFVEGMASPPRVLFDSGADSQALTIIGDCKTTLHFSADGIAVSEGSCH